MADTVVPCFALPFTLGADGEFATVEQDSLDDLAASVAILVGTERGSRLEMPGYGVADPTFATSLDDADVISQLHRYEPRAAVTLTTGSVNDLLAYQVQILVGKATSP